MRDPWKTVLGSCQRLRMSSGRWRRGWAGRLATGHQVPRERLTGDLQHGLSMRDDPFSAVLSILLRLGVIGSVPDPSLGRLAGRSGPAIGHPVPCHAAGALQVPTGGLGTSFVLNGPEKILFLGQSVRVSHFESEEPLHSWGRELRNLDIRLIPQRSCGFFSSIRSHFLSWKPLPIDCSGVVKRPSDWLDPRESDEEEAHDSLSLHLGWAGFPPITVLWIFHGRLFQCRWVQAWLTCQSQEVVWNCYITFPPLIKHCYLSN
jgi:hypothetical protein